MIVLERPLSVFLQGIREHGGDSVILEADFRWNVSFLLSCVSNDELDYREAQVSIFCSYCLNPYA